jgi:hypothetical protein
MISKTPYSPVVLPPTVGDPDNGNRMSDSIFKKEIHVIGKTATNPVKTSE